MNTTNILGVKVSATNLSHAVATIESWISTRHRTYVCITGVHGIMESQRDPELRSIHNDAGLVTPDGMPLVYVSRLVGNTDVGRVYGPDLMQAICCNSSLEGPRHFLYGTTVETLTKLKSQLLSRFPTMQIVGVYAPPFRLLSDVESEQICLQINACHPDIVWVGLSTPKQERWMAQHRPMLNAPVLIGVGAAFDFHAGITKQAPRWMQPLCLEWLFRLFVEPRRLWKRYLTNNPLFIWLITLQLLRLRRYSH